MTQLLENNNITVLEGARKKDGGLGSDNKERCHPLVVGSSYYSSFIIDSRASRHTAFVKYFFSSMYSDSGPTIRMGDYSKIQAKWIGIIELEDGYFNNVLFVPELEANLLSIYQMNHTGESKSVTFTIDSVEIIYISTNKVVPLRFVDHQETMYKLSHFLPYSRGKALMSHANEPRKMRHDRFIHMKYRYL